MNKRQKLQRRAQRRYDKAQEERCKNRLPMGEMLGIDDVGRMDARVGAWLSSPKLTPRTPDMKRDGRVQA